MQANTTSNKPIVNSNNKPKFLADDKGFTLIEIIAVLVILGILAAVAVPRYFDLQEEAQEKALAAAMGEALGRVNQYFAQQVLLGTPTDEIVYNTDNLSEDMGDFTLTATENGDSITLTVVGNTPGPLGNASTTRIIARPNI